MWHIGWLLQLIPKNKKATIWLVVALIALSVALTNLSKLQTPRPPRASVFLFFGGLMVGLPSAIVFYYYQAKPKAGYSETDTLGHYYKNEVAKPNITIVSTNQPEQPPEKTNK